MFIFYTWVTFVILIGISETDAEHYFLFCFTMFYFTFIYNRIYSIRLSPKLISLFLILPSAIMWWIAYVYNYLLSINPLEDYLVIFSIFLYFYILIFIYWESN